jgi:alpha 1,3-glucosidase
MYGYDKFKGSSDLFHIWIDMNEPSVFGGHEGTLPSDSKHYLGDGTTVYHKDVHNAYGLMMSMATYDGLY